MPGILAAPYDSIKGNFTACIIMLVMCLEIEEVELEETTHEPQDLISKSTFVDNTK